MYLRGRQPISFPSNVLDALWNVLVKRSDNNTNAKGVTHYTCMSVLVVNDFRDRVRPARSLASRRVDGDGGIRPKRVRKTEVQSPYISECSKAQY
jgi:hypothetical protein